MKPVSSVIMILLGSALVIFFGFVFLKFNAFDEVLALPFSVEPLLISLLMIGLGATLILLGIYFRRKSEVK